MSSAIDQRRMRDGARALEITMMPPETIREAQAQLTIIDDGIAALQSLDTLGSEASTQASRDHQELQKRRESLMRRISQASERKQRRLGNR